MQQCQAAASTFVLVSITFVLAPNHRPAVIIQFLLTSTNTFECANYNIKSVSSEARRLLIKHNLVEYQYFQEFSISPSFLGKILSMKDLEGDT